MDDHQILSRIRLDSQYLSSLDIKEDNDSLIEAVKISTGYNIYLLVRLYSKDYYFTEEEIIILLKQLYELVSGKFEEVFQIAKIYKVKQMEIENINYLLLDRYNSLKLDENSSFYFNMTKMAVENNFLHILEWINKYNSHKIENSKSFFFDLACEKGFFKIAQWFCENFKIDYIWINNTFSKACSNNNLDAMIWVYDIFGEKNLLKDEFQFKRFNVASKKGYLEIVKYLHSFGTLTREDILKGFELACINNQFPIINWIYSIIDFSHEERFKIFEIICIRGSLEVAIHLFYLEPFPEKILNRFCKIFDKLCQDNNLIMAQWIYSLNYVNLDEKELLFQISCSKGNYKIVKWIYEEFGGISEDTIKESFYNVCGILCNLELSKYLFSLTKINIHRGNDEMLFFNCVKGNFEMVQWILSVGRFKLFILESMIKLTTDTRFYEISNYISNYLENECNN